KSAVVDPVFNSTAQRTAATNKAPKGATIIANANVTTAGAKPRSLTPLFQKSHPVTSNLLFQNLPPITTADLLVSLY
ncbi:MAG: hypothetical protein J2P31_18560, partial [Blastocatellia bacterium]|nr:hypothetical protein [Blastocatellia bacterium]